VKRSFDRFLFGRRERPSERGLSRARNRVAVAAELVEALPEGGGGRVALQLG
jgi:hypothetical protein